MDTQAPPTNKTAPIPQLSLAERRRFWSRVAVNGPDECWPWTGARDWDGYGLWTIRRDSTHRVRRATRIAWTITSGPIPEGLCVCHHCDNPPCCNPAHLFLATQADNQRDATRKGRRARGEKAGHVKLTEQKVLAIRTAYAQGESTKDIGIRFGINDGTAHNAATGRTWRHVPNIQPPRKHPVWYKRREVRVEVLQARQQAQALRAAERTVRQQAAEAVQRQIIELYTSGAWTQKALSTHLNVPLIRINRIIRKSGPWHHRKGLRKLSPQSVRAIRRLRAEGAKMGVLAAQFGVDPSTISNVMSRRTWVSGEQ